MAGKGVRVSGIFIPVQLDTTEMQKNLESVKTEMGTLSTAITKSFDKTLSVEKFTNRLVKVTQALGRVEQGAKALALAKPFDQIAQGTSGASAALETVSQKMRLSSASLNELYSNLGKRMAINEQVTGLKELQRAYMATADEALQLARAQGIVISQEAKAQFIQSGKNRGWSGIFTPTSVAAGAQSAMASLGVVGGMYGVAELGKAMYSASLQMENFQLAFQSVYGSASKATAQLDYVRKITDELGISFAGTAQSAKQLFAAAKGTELDKDVNQIFKAFTTMGSALKLSGDEMNSVFLAISQIISKGKVSAEELRLQLAERMPGAVTLFAKSIGVTTKQLDEMLQKGEVGLGSLKKFAVEVEKTYAAGARTASSGLQAEMNRVSNAWFDLKRSFVDTESSARMLSTLTDSLKAIGAVAPQIAATTSVLAKFAVVAGGLMALVKAGQAAVAMFTSLKLAMAGAAAASAATPWGAIATVVAGLATAFWELSSSQTEGEKVLDKYNTKIYTLSEWAKTATDKTADLNAEIEKNARLTAEKAAKTASTEFQSLITPSPTNWGTIDLFGSSFKLETQTQSPLEKYLAELAGKIGSSPEAKKLAESGAKLARDFVAEMNTGLKSGASMDVLLPKINDFRTKAFSMYNDLSKMSGVSNDLAEGFEKFMGALAATSENAVTANAALKEVGSTSTEQIEKLRTVADAFDAIQKATKTSTETGKNTEAQKNVESLVTQLSKMAPAAREASARLQEVNDVQKRTAEAIAADQKLVDDFNQALALVGEAATSAGVGMDSLGGFLTSLGNRLQWAAGAWDSFRKMLAQGVSLGGSSQVKEILADLQLRKDLTKSSAGEKAAFTGLKQFKSVAKEDYAPLLQSVKSGDVAKIAELVHIETSEAKALLKAYEETASTVDFTKGAKSAEAAFNKVNGVIDATRTKIDSWKAKLDESKPEAFVVTLEKELRKLDATIASSKGTASQVAQMRELRAEMERVGRLREQQIAAEESQKAREAFTKDQKRVTSAYRKVVGEDNKDVLEAARAQYDIDAKNFKDALDKKVISYDEYSSMIKMIDTNLADTQLRSQTDLYSRLQVTADEYFKKYGDFTKGIGDVVTNAMNSSASAIAAFAVNGARDFNSLADAFNKMAESILSTVAQLLAQQAVAAMFSSIMGFFNTGGSSGLATSGQYSGSTGNRFGHAKGGAYYGGGLSSYSNTVVSTPTLFSMGTPAFAYGAGLMGEAGPEAIMPLVRTSSGHLGVRSEGGSGINQTINVNVIDNAGVSTRTEQSTDNQGNVSLDIILDQKNAESLRKPGSASYRAMQNMWGGRTALANR